MNFIKTLRASKLTAKNLSKNCQALKFFIHSKIVTQYDGSIEGRKVEKTRYVISNYKHTGINQKYIGFFYKGKFSK